MDSTTKLQLDSILNRGYYTSGQTLGEGGWGEFYKQTEDKPWGKYVLYMFSDDEDDEAYPIEITARDYGTAHGYFLSNYTLPEHYQIVRRIVLEETLYEQ